jgi:hypothetical protein
MIVKVNQDMGMDKIRDSTFICHDANQEKVTNIK